MPPRSPRAPASDAKPAGSRRLPTLDFALGGAAVAAALWALWPATRSFFSPDDLIILGRAAGIADAPDTWWRILPGRWVPGWAWAAFGTDPRGYLVANLALHAVNTALVFALARRLALPSAAAALAAILFGASRLAYPVVAQVATAGELMACGFWLLTSVLLLTRDSRVRWLAIPAFASALLSKENVLLLPLAFAPLLAGRREPRPDARGIAAMLVLAIGWASYLALTGIRATALGGEAYRLALGPNLVENLARYLGTIAGFREPFPDPGTGGDTAWGVLAFAGLVAASAHPRFRADASVSWFGWSWFLLALVPVLPLVGHRYLHYLYLPLAGLALGIGALVAGAIRRAERIEAMPASGRSNGPRMRVRVPIALALGAMLIGGYVLVSRLDLDRQLSRTLEDVDLPRDAFHRKSELLRRISVALAPYREAKSARLVVLVPALGGDSDFYRGLMVGVIDAGRSVRTLLPGIDSIAIVPEWQAGYRDFDLVAGTVDGRWEIFGRGAEAHRRLIGRLEAAGFRDEAERHRRAVSAGPDAPGAERGGAGTSEGAGAGKRSRPAN